MLETQFQCMSNVDGARFWGQTEPEQRTSHCKCKFDPGLAQGLVGSWHFLRSCQSCGTKWGGLHCPHDLGQGVCAGCGAEQVPMKVGILDWNYKRTIKDIVLSIKKWIARQHYLKDKRLPARPVALFSLYTGIGTNLSKRQRKQVIDLMRHKGISPADEVRGRPSYGPYEINAEIPLGCVRTESDGSPESVKSGIFSVEG